MTKSEKSLLFALKLLSKMMQVPKSLKKYANTYTHTHSNTYTHTQTHTHTHTHTQTHTHSHSHLHTHIHTLTYTHKHKHLHTHTHKKMQTLSLSHIPTNTNTHHTQTAELGTIMRPLNVWKSAFAFVFNNLVKLVSLMGQTLKPRYPNQNQLESCRTWKTKKQQWPLHLAKQDLRYYAI